MPHNVQGLYKVRDVLQPIVPESYRQKRKTRRWAGFLLSLDIELAMLVLIFMLVFVFATTGM